MFSYRKQLGLYGFMAEQGLDREDASVGVYWMVQNSGDDGLMEVADPGGAIDDAENLLNRTMERIRTGDVAVVDVPHGQVWERCELRIICNRARTVKKCGMLGRHPSCRNPQTGDVPNWRHWESDCPDDIIPAESRR